MICKVIVTHRPSAVDCVDMLRRDHKCLLSLNLGKISRVTGCAGNCTIPVHAGSLGRHTSNKVACAQTT